MEFEWTNFSGFTTLGILDETQNMMTELKCELEHFQGRIIFMSMFNDIDRVKRGNQRKLYCECSQSYLNMLENSCEDIGNFQGLDRRRNGTDSRMQPRRTMGRSCWECDDQFCGKRKSCIPCIQRSWTRRIEKYRGRIKNHSLQR